MIDPDLPRPSGALAALAAKVLLAVAAMTIIVSFINALAD